MWIVHSLTPPETAVKSISAVSLGMPRNGVSVLLGFLQGHCATLCSAQQLLVDVVFLSPPGAFSLSWIALYLTPDPLSYCSFAFLFVFSYHLVLAYFS